MRSVRFTLSAIAFCSVSICSSARLALTSAARSAFGSALTADTNFWTTSLSLIVAAMPTEAEALISRVLPVRR